MPLDAYYYLFVTPGIISVFVYIDELCVCGNSGKRHFSPYHTARLHRNGSNRHPKNVCSLSAVIYRSQSAVQSTDLWKNIDQCRAKKIDPKLCASVCVCVWHEQVSESARFRLTTAAREHLSPSIAASVRLFPRARPSSALNHRRNKQIPVNTL